jgi:hypothetical protein
LKTSVSEFPQFGLVGRITTAEEEQNLPEQNEFENYELEEEDPHRIEHESDLRIEQEEYFRLIHQEWIDPGSYE